MAVEIRMGNETDVPAIVRLNHGLFQEDGGTRDPHMNVDWPLQEGSAHFSELLAKDTTHCLVAEADGRAAGYLIGYIRGPNPLRRGQVAELESMFVEPAYRSQGVGGRLVTQFLNWATSRGVDRVSVTALAANRDAIRFYERLGFQPQSLTLEVGCR